MDGWTWIFFVFGSTPPRRPNKASLDVCQYVRTSIRLSTKSLNEIWCVGRGWWVMHNSMQYSQIQGQGQGHVALEVSNSFIFKMYFLHHFPWELANDCWFLNQRTISKFVVSLQVFMSPDLELGRKLRCYWYLAITRWVMHNSVLYGLIQGQGQGLSLKSGHLNRNWKY